MHIESAIKKGVFKRMNKACYCIIAIESVVIIALLILIINICNKESHTVVFTNDTIQDFPVKMEYAEKNMQYALWESKYMSIYSSPTDVVFVGDSITYRCQWHELFPDLCVKNRGIGSDTTGGLLARLDSIIKTRPTKVFLMIGINDICTGVSVEEIGENYKKIIDTLQKEEIEIYVQSILPVIGDHDWGGQPEIETVNAIIKHICEEKQVGYIDLYPEFKGRAEYYEYDGVHLTSAGYKVWYETIENVVNSR